jgi:tripartite-type tricarboxylate transporter receptor subunit TctC
MMNRDRFFKKFVTVFSPFFLLGLWTPNAVGIDFPTKPITLVIGSQAGSAPDTLARIIAEGMAEILKQPVVAENRPGAAGAIAASSVARSNSDGHTLMMMTAVHSISPTTRSDLDYSFVDDFKGIGMVASVPLLFVVNKDLGTRDLSAFIARAKQGDIFYGTPGVGTLQHLATEDFALKTGVKMTMIPYKGGGAATKAVIANEVQLFFAGIPPALPHVKSGAISALGISSAKRSPAAPDVKTFQELGFADYNIDNWHALYVPKGTPDEVVVILSKALNDVLNRPVTAERFLNVGATPSPSSPDEQTKFGQDEVKRWRQIVLDSGIELTGK